MLSIFQFLVSILIFAFAPIGPGSTFEIYNATVAIYVYVLRLVLVVKRSNPEKKTKKIPRAEKGKRVDNRREQDLSPTRLEAQLFFHR